jgi:DNA-binding NarL/FixJ family response regulator
MGEADRVRKRRRPRRDIVVIGIDGRARRALSVRGAPAGRVRAVEWTESVRDALERGAVAAVVVAAHNGVAWSDVATEARMAAPSVPIALVVEWFDADALNLSHQLRVVCLCPSGAGFVDQLRLFASRAYGGDDTLASRVDRIVERQGEVVGLSVRQRQMLAGVLLGWSRRKIATKRGLSADTIKTHMRRLLRAFGAANGAELRSMLLGSY